MSFKKSINAIFVAHFYYFDLKGVHMRPPICAICDKDFLDLENGGLVYFKKRPSDIEWDTKMEKKGMVGHPPYAEWFCEEHYAKAKELEDNTIDKAMKILQETFG